MNRRSFLSSIGALGLGATSLGLTGNPLEPNLSLSSSLKPNQAQVSPTKTGVDITFSTSAPNGELLVVQNKYGYPSKTLAQQSQSVSQGTRSVTLALQPEHVQDMFAYTAYFRTSSTSDWRYIGESEPLTLTNNTIQQEKLYDIKTKRYNTLIDDEHGQLTSSHYWVPIVRTFSLSTSISKQYLYRSTSRFASYGKGQDAVTDGAFTAQLASQFRREASRHDISSSEGLFRLAVKFVQTYEWVPDESFEYIQSPLQTVAFGHGDCEDTVLLLNGLLESPLFDYETAMLFAPSHVMTGVAISSLDFNVHELTSEPVQTVSVGDTEYMPIETSLKTKIGKLMKEPIHTVYVDSYVVRDAKSAVTSSVNSIE